MVTHKATYFKNANCFAARLQIYHHSEWIVDYQRVGHVPKNGGWTKQLNEIFFSIASDPSFLSQDGC